jgi:putative endonuclease
MPHTNQFTRFTRFTRWRFWKRWFGQRSERAAAKHLRKLGWRIVAVNVSDQLGEIDLLAIDGETLVIVEVRSTSTADPHIPAASVDLRKQKKLTDAAVRFLSRRGLLGISYRFDVLALAWPPEQSEPTVLHLRHSFEATGRFQMFS